MPRKRGKSVEAYEYSKKYRKSCNFTCGCGNKAVKYDNGSAACSECLRKEKNNKTITKPHKEDKNWEGPSAEDEYSFGGRI